MKLVAEPRFHRPAPRPVNLYFEAEELLGLRDRAAGPPADSSSSATEEVGAGTSATVAAPGASDPAPPNQSLNNPAEETPSPASSDEPMTAAGLCTGGTLPQERGESTRPGGSAGGDCSAAGTGPQPRDPRHRGGRPRGPQSPRE